ncbi:hypothetical protein BDR04DRAFT_1097929 [Suillus decipiens]|nr:hypothetical protein BDR04DRAFT_1097929 [Suillus decipiens]
MQMVERHKQQAVIMHSALTIYGIIYAILQHVKSSTSDLTNVAVTCSTLSGSAINMLWCEQSSLSSLIMCLPQDTWRQRKISLL